MLPALSAAPPKAPDRGVPLRAAEAIAYSLVTDKNLEGKALKEFRNEDFAGKLQVVRLERGIGYHVMKINPAVLMGGVAGARSHSGPAREASKDMGFGYFAMLLAK